MFWVLISRFHSRYGGHHENPSKANLFSGIRLICIGHYQILVILKMLHIGSMNVKNLYLLRIGRSYIVNLSSLCELIVAQLSIPFTLTLSASLRFQIAPLSCEVTVFKDIRVHGGEELDCEHKGGGKELVVSDTFGFQSTTINSERAFHDREVCKTFYRALTKLSFTPNVQNERYIYKLYKELS